MIRRTALMVFLSLAITNTLFAQIGEYLHRETIKVAGITSDDQLYNLTIDQKQDTRFYFDGLGRPIQTVSIKASPSQHDMVQISSYDNSGRQAYQYLPYTAGDGTGSFKSGSLSAQASFYSNGLTDKVADDSAPFSKSLFENSPLQRLLQAGGVGSGFQPGEHYKSVSYRQNQSGDAVISWGPDGTNQGQYAVNTLSCTVFTDEHGNQTLTFTDQNGKLRLKRSLIDEVINGVTETSLDNYYIYNDAGSLAYILPPKAVSFMRNAGNWNLSQTEVQKLMFSYRYDERNRLIEKNIPGVAVLYMVYDPLNRPVLVQDGNMRNVNQWTYIKYDIKGRAISQGIYTDDTYTTRTAMQGFVNSQNYGTVYFEGRSSNSATNYYTNQVFPVSNISPLAFSYYDDYDLNQDGSADYSYQTQGLANEQPASAYTRGMLTATAKRSVGQGLSNIWLTSYMFYDKNGRTIQIRNNNQLNSSVNDVKTLVTDFTGKALQIRIVKNTGSTTTVLSSYTYDHSQRIKSIDESYNGAAAVHVANYEYNELGQLVKKNLNALSGGGYLQSVDFRYNIKGSAISINNSTLTVDDKNGDTNDVFGMEVLYNNTDNALGNTAGYGGLVSAIKWKTAVPNTTTDERAYRYSYDSQNRLKNALYSNRSGSGSWVNSGAFDEKNLLYDQNSNILALQRNALVSGSVAAIDDLNYSYDGNRLTNVTDATGTNYAGLGVKNLTGSTTGYSYDDNGNMKSDDKKGLLLDYNAFSKTDKITITTATGRYLTYSYDGEGNLLRKQAFDNNTLVKTTDYIDGFVYENSSLSYFAMAEGRVRNTGTGLKAEYVITDLQGNARVSFEENSGQLVARQENSYYPFGLVMSGSYTPTDANKNLYNGGSEWQNDFADMPDLYQTFFRMYDAALGRFINADPRADESHEVSPYQYALNNPLWYNDPLGDKQQMNVQEAIQYLWDKKSKYGGTWSASSGTATRFTSDDDAFNVAAGILGVDAFGKNGLLSYNEAAAKFNNDNSRTGGRVFDDWKQLRDVDIREASSNQNWLIERQKEAFSAAKKSSWHPGFAKGPDGEVQSLNLSYVLGGGWTVEIGVVTDKHGGRRWFFSHGPALGLNISASVNVKEIRAEEGKTFSVNDYEGPGSGYTLGYGFLGAEYSGNRRNKTYRNTDLYLGGSDYSQFGYSVAEGFKIGAAWSRTNTTFIGK
ncbi:DUF6443 domain-containing protein [Pedobacter sp. KBW01]|uniref:DUF6443 domain-containing protein n=1 Tax=Pedobacter sp. KBW01 TaxID=2153364 RepID=UPI001319DA08|nr:DUF6443 domain-containing protein [Pedobacter sp. KBW01]